MMLDIVAHIQTVIQSSACGQSAFFSDGSKKKCIMHKIIFLKNMGGKKLSQLLRFFFFRLRQSTFCSMVFIYRFEEVQRFEITNKKKLPSFFSEFGESVVSCCRFKLTF